MARCGSSGSRFLGGARNALLFTVQLPSGSERILEDPCGSTSPSKVWIDDILGWDLYRSTHDPLPIPTLYTGPLLLSQREVASSEGFQCALFPVLEPEMISQ